MDEDPVIRSRSNALLKRIGAAQAGRDADCLVLEGDRLIDDALAAGLEFDALLVAEDRAARAGELESRGLPGRLVEAPLLARVSSLETSPGILALAKRPSLRPLAELGADRFPRVLVVAGIQDPGNLGALARSAEAAGFGALVCASGGAKPFGPKALRGSMGSLLRLAVFEGVELSEGHQRLESEGYRQVGAATRDGSDWRSFDWSAPIAIWVGGETGAAHVAMKDLESVSIPMAGEVESLNVTVATSLLLFAAGDPS